MQYFITPNHCIAVNHKVGTNSICRAIVETYYPERVGDVEIESDWAWRTYVDQTDSPDKPTVMLVRDPVERFLSACAMFGLEADDALKQAKEHHIEHIDQAYFQPQSTFKADKIFRFPDQIDEFCKEVGFASFATLNERANEKPSLTKAQRGLIEKFYKDDLDLILSVK